MDTPRCKVHRLKMDDVDRSVDDPALAAMIAAGWTVICPLAMEERGEVIVTLILAPPIKYKSTLKPVFISIVATALTILAASRLFI